MPNRKHIKRRMAWIGGALAILACAVGIWCLLGNNITVRVTGLRDEQLPQLLVVRELSLYLGGTISYRCGFCSYAKVMFGRLGISNIVVRRNQNVTRNDTRDWNIDSLEDGKTCCHYDCTPRRNSDYRVCLITDSERKEAERYETEYYLHDKSIYPTTPDYRPGEEPG